MKTPQPATRTAHPAGPAASPAARHPSRARGVALVITLILISVITFLAITFLALSRRERGQVTVTVDQTTARLAADAGQDRAVAELLATILANTNAFNFDLLASTNFINPFGYDPTAVDFRTNVNFEYQNDASATALSANQSLENLTHLLYNPRPPVFVVTNRALPGSNEFRYYLDLNRDGRPTRTGWLVVTNQSGGFYDLNGDPIPPVNFPPNAPLPANVLNRYFSGDPEFIGILTRPEFPHSPTNQFVSRYAYIVVPAGKTLDVNYVHNAARIESRDDLLGPNRFRRNQGVGGWENNLASLFVDLNTNAWPGPLQVATTLGSPYEYYPDLDISSGGSAFEDGQAFIRYRHGRSLSAATYSFATSYPNRAQNMWFDGVDAYALSGLVSNTVGLLPRFDPTRPLLPFDQDNSFTGVLPYSGTLWSGSEKPNHLFTTQDFFDQSKLPVSFINRLRNAQTFLNAGTVPSSYNTYTYYRLLSQLGTDSAPEPASAAESGGRLNLNFVNLPPFRTTNFVTWTSNAVRNTYGRPGSEIFFSNAVDRLVRRYTSDWISQSFVTFTNVFRTNQAFGAGRIPVFVNTNFVYPASLHRQFQLAANMWDAVNASNVVAGSMRTPIPTVFRPVFLREGTNVYIQDFVEVTDASTLDFSKLVDLGISDSVNTVQPDSLIFGVPFVIGARKGLPNFNEFASEAVISVTRKLELVKSADGGANLINQTNQMLVIGVSNVFGAEFWNSYLSNYPLPVTVSVTNFSRLALTNDYGYLHTSNLVAGALHFTNANGWVAWNPRRFTPPSVGPWSFLVPLKSNHVILPDSVYRFGARNFERYDAINSLFERGLSRQEAMAFPRFGLTITNRVLAIIRSGNRIIDYVQLSGIVGHQDITLMIAQPNTALGFQGVWGTNALAVGSPFLTGLPGIIQQIQISKGEVEAGKDWLNYSDNPLSGKTRDQAIANFLAFFENGHTYNYQPNSGGPFRGTNFARVATAPFSPTRKFSVPMIYQANDPLVHYTVGDLEDVERTGIMVPWTPPSSNQVVVENLGKLNRRYQPWGGNPNATSFGSSPADDKLAYQSAAKDPGIWSSEWWQFPTNRLPTLGWLGRIHRGTPWQTVYLKSTRAEEALAAKATENKVNEWQRWTGNRTVWRTVLPNGVAVWNDAYLSQPEQDRNWLELFTTALNESATRGQLPINQSGLAAWSAVFGGMLALTNTSTESDLLDYGGPSAVGPFFIEPAGVYDFASAGLLPPVVQIVEGINNTRTNRTLFPSATFTRLGHLLATPQLSDASPFLNFTGSQKEKGLTDPMIEWLPQQMLSLVRLGEPRFVIYSFGQTLKPAPRSIQLSGPFSQLCTNYQITAEVATRAVVRVVGSPDPRQVGNPDPAQNYPPRIVVESFNVLPPD